MPLTKSRKIPYRLSRPQKLRHRRRLRRVDNIVAVLDNALKRRVGFATSSAQSQTTLASSEHESTTTSPSNQASSQELATTIEVQTLLSPELPLQQRERRHGKGPKQGDMVPQFSPHGVRMSSGQLLRDEAKLHGTTKLIERWKAEMPTESEMRPKDKYSVFSRYAKVRVIDEAFVLDFC